MAEFPKIISVDDHVVEPPGVWQDRLPAKYREIGPHVEYLPGGNAILDGGGYIEEPGTEGPLAAWWFYEDHKYSVKRLIAAAGYPADEITTAGIRFFTEFGIELPALRTSRRHFCRLCFDWTERRPHIAGALGAATTKRYFDLGWMERMQRSHAVIVTPLGRRGFRETFGVDTSEPGDPHSDLPPPRRRPRNPR